MADIRSHGLFIIGTNDSDFLQGYNAPSAPGDTGASQLLTGFGLDSWSSYGLTPGSLSIDSYTETVTEIADGNDALLGGEGNDTLLGGGGNDSLIGGAAGFFGNDDVLYGGWGDDILIAGNAAQTTDGGNDTLVGGPGDDILNGMDGGDFLDGGTGIDVAVYAKPKTSYDIGFSDGAWQITDLQTGATDTLTDVEYIFFETPTAPSPADAKARILAFEEFNETDGNVFPLTYLYIDSDTQIPFDFEPVSVYDGSGVPQEVVKPFEGSEPLGHFSPGQRAQIISAVQAIFDRSGIDIGVTDQKPLAESTTVRFSGDKIFYDSDDLDAFPEMRLLGRAYQDVDQFNKQPGNIVAVFMDGTDPIDRVIETIAHEGAHAMGVRHVNPIPGVSSEVEDYQPSSSPQFVSTPVNITEPPKDGKPPQISTHNPTYHIRKYTLHESDANLRAENIVPGSYDLGVYLLASYSISFASLAEPLTDLSIILTGRSDSVEGGDPSNSLGVVRLLADQVQSGDVVTFLVPKGETFRIVASTSSASVIDASISFETTAGAKLEITAGESISLAGEILLFEPSGTSVAIGSAALTVTEEIVVDSGTPSTNNAPTATDDMASTTADHSIVIAAADLLANDTDANGDTLSISGVDGATNGTVTFDATTHEITFTPDAGYTGPASFTYTISDGNGGTGQATVNVAVTADGPTNAAPTALADSYSTDEDGILTISAPGLLGNDTDADGDSLTAALVEGPAHGTLALAPDGSFTYTPDANYNGTDSFTYMANDGSADSAPVTVDLTVNAVNDNPIGVDDARTMTADHTVALSSASLLANDTDIDGDALAVSGVVEATHGTAVFDPATSKITFTPDAGYVGSASVTYGISDGNGGTAQATVNIDVNAPGSFVLTPVAQSYLSAGKELINGLGGSEDFGEDVLPLNDDGSSGPIDISSVFGDAGLNFFGTDYTSIFVNNNGSITFAQPTPQYTPTQITGGTNNPIIAAFWADVDTRGGPTGATPGGTSTGANHVSYDLDSVNGVLTITWDDVGYFGNHVDKANAFQMQLINQGDGNFDIVFRYEDINWSAGDASNGVGGLGGVPARAGFSAGNGTDYYELPQSGDEAGILALENSVGNTGRAGVWQFQVRNGEVVPPANQDPVAADDAASTIAGAVLTIAAADLLANDTDANGDALAITGVSAAQHGSVDFDQTTNQITFTPDAGYTGPASFTYAISDGKGGTGQATVNVTVDPAPNQAPVATGDSYTTNEDVALAVAGPGVLGNDTDGDSNPLTATLVSGPSHGELTLNADGSFTYTPSANYNGTDSFAYMANDGSADSAPVTVDLTVTAVNDNPVAVDNAAATLAGHPLVLSAATILANDTDADGDTLSITGVEGATNGTVIFNEATHEVTFTPNAGYSGPASFTYAISDGNGGTSQATVNVTVDPIGPFTPYIAQLNSPGDLVSAMLSNSPGITVDPASVQYAGADGQASFYDGSLAGLGIGSGILLTSGDATPPTTNTSGNYSVNQGGSGDADLTKVLTDAGFAQATLDVDYLVFSFTVTDPTIKSISLDVVFGSDEYPEFANNIVDVAGVFVNGVNYALFNSDPTQPLSVLQKNIDTGSFIDNQSGSLPIEYDGLSIPLKVTAPVVQGLNTIKIAIADTSDRIYDSGLFVSNFKASTDETGGGIIVDPEPENTAPEIVHSALVPPLSSCSPFVTLGPDDLSATDDDGDTLTYAMDRAPAGILLVNGVIAGVGTTFTQSDVDNGLVTLFAGAILPSAPISTPKGPVSGAGVSFLDSFDFTVSDGAGGEVSGVFTAPYQSFDKVQTTPAYCDSYNGGAGNDYQLGTAKADHMSGGAGCDLMIGGGGNDKMEGGKGNDRLFGQDGHDTLAGGSGDDLLDGGAGNDTLRGDAGDNWLFGGDGNDRISAGSGHDHIYGGSGADYIEAGSGNNRIDGGEGKDDIRSGKGNDTIVGGTGNDLIRDDGGINKFQLGGIGGAISDGNDHYWTGKGADEFVLLLNDRNGGEAGWGSDTIYDFRLKQGDHLLAFNPKAGFWDDASDLASLVEQGFVTGQRSANGGDLTLTFGTGDVRSSVTLKEFFWNNASYLSPSEKAASCGGALGASALVGILEDVVMDGSNVGVDGVDYLAKAHHYISQDFLV